MNLTRSTSMWAYDIECYKNYTYFLFINVKSLERRDFRIYEEGCEYDRNDVEALREFCNDETKYLAGYNSYEYDNQLVNYCIKTKTIGTFTVNRLTNTLKYISDNIINNGYSAHKYDRFYQKVDLMRVGGLQKSLKYCMMNLRMNLIQDLPIKPHMSIQPEDVLKIEAYCANDVEAVVRMIASMRDGLIARFNAETQYGVPAVNESNSSIANHIFTKMYSDATKTPQRLFNDLRSPIDSISLNDIIFPNVGFDSPELKEYLKSIRHRVIDCSKEKISVDLPILNYKKTSYNFGAGGLHSIDIGGIYEETEEYYLMDADVTSYYPSLIIIYMLYPEHLDRLFLEVLKYVRDKRVDFKKSGDSIASYIFKIVINSIFGKMGSKHSWLYSPKRMLQTTVNGQLFLIMLVEMLELKGFEVFSANTDGVTAKVPKHRVDEYFAICKKWEAKTDMGLEYARYKKYIRKDVNNYLAQYYDKDNLIEIAKDSIVKPVYRELKIKRKGKILNSTLYKDLTKSYYMPVVAAAIETHFLNGTKVSTFIRNHTDAQDFYIGSSVGKKFDVYYITSDGKQELIQNTLRYYVSKSGGKLIKTDTYTSKSISTEKVKLALEHDEHRSIDSYDIDYFFYIGEAMKWIDKIDKEHKTHQSKFRDNYVQTKLEFS